MANVAGATIELIERYAPDIDIPPPVVLEQARRNLALRVRLLQEFGAVDAKELAELAGSAARNPATTVDNWRRAHRVVAVRWKGRTLVPGFQLLATGQPNPALQPVLRALAEYGMGDWEQALWFVLPSAALGGARPVDRLAADPEAVAAAASRSRDWF